MDLLPYVGLQEEHHDLFAELNDIEFSDPSFETANIYNDLSNCDMELDKCFGSCCDPLLNQSDFCVSNLCNTPSSDTDCSLTMPVLTSTVLHEPALRVSNIDIGRRYYDEVSSTTSDVIIPDQHTAVSDAKENERPIANCNKDERNNTNECVKFHMTRSVSRRMAGKRAPEEPVLETMLNNDPTGNCTSDEQCSEDQDPDEHSLVNTQTIDVHFHEYAKIDALSTEKGELVLPTMYKSRSTRKTWTKKRKRYEEKPSKDPEFERSRRNAVNAKMNRERKKLLIHTLEDQVGTLSTENRLLKGENQSLSKHLTELRDEVRYLKSIITNQSALSGILHSLKSSDVKLSSTYSAHIKREIQEESTFDTHKGGVCVHVDGSHVSLEFCAKCSNSASHNK